MILEATLAADYSPGTNQSADLACADWRFLLPSMTLGQVVCVGKPRLTTLKVLSSLSERIVVITDHADSEPLILDDHCEVIVNPAKFELSAGQTALVLITDQNALQRFYRDEDYRTLILSALTDDGCICFEQSFAKSVGTDSRRLRALLDSTRPLSAQTYWVTKKGGELTTAVPLHDRKISSYFFEKVLYGMSFKKRALSRIGRLASNLGLMPYFNQGSVTLVRPRAVEPTQPPEFLCRLAADCGVRIDTHRFGMAARGRYNSNKVVYHLFPEQDANADLVIKMTRSVMFNCRLEHERDMLTMVRDSKLASTGSYPEPLFFGYHNGLAVLGERAMDGRPFRTETSSQPDCPVASKALDWITTLGRNSSRAMPSTEVVSQLRQLVALFGEIYVAEPAHLQFLESQIDAIAERTRDFPIVFCHGDAGSWNVMIGHDGRAIFLDWEAAEPSGMPLWDLFYFFRSFGNWVARQRGKESDTHASFERTFMQRGELNDRLIYAVNGYCAAVGLDRSLVAPMFYTCWMHRALRQATWASSIVDAHFVSVLRSSIDNRSASGLAALFETS